MAIFKWRRASNTTFQRKISNLPRCWLLENPLW